MSDCSQSSQRLESLGRLYLKDKAQNRDVPNGEDSLLLQQALAAYRSRKFASASRLCHAILKNEPDNHHANNLMHLIAMGSGRYALAVRYLAKAIENKTDEPLYHSNLAQLLLEMKQFDKSLMACEKAISLGLDQFRGLLLMGDIFLEQDRTAEAENSYREAIALRPESIQAYNRMGNLKIILGRFAEAEEFLERACQIDSGNSVTRNLQAQVKKETMSQKDLKSLEQLFLDEATPVENRIVLAFNIGSVYEKAKQYDQAFEYFDKANNMQRKHFKWDQSTSFRDQFLYLRRAFDSSLFQRMAGVGSQDRTPIFVLGMPRSGTTLTEQILASHPDVFGAGELSYMGKAFFSFIAGDNKKLGEKLEMLSPEKCRAMGDAYVEHLREHSATATYVTDKMPGNFQYIGLIRLILPQAKIIYCRREPADICLSIFKHHFNEGHRYATDLRELGVYHGHFRTLMKHWLALFPDAIHTVNYENMVADQRRETERLLEYCGLPWDERCMRFHEHGRAVRTLSLTQVRKPMYQSSSQLWRKYEEHLQPLLEMLERADE